MNPPLRPLPSARSGSRPTLSVAQDHFDNMELLSHRLDDRNPGTPPWVWTNLTTEHAGWTEQALDGFIADYNLTFVTTLDELVPGCWRQHPALATELLVLFWSWWACHLNPKATVHAVDDFYERTLPMFQGRLLKRLLGPGAVNCRKGRHAQTADPELARAIEATLSPTGDPEAMQRIRNANFGTGATPPQ